LKYSGKYAGKAVATNPDCDVTVRVREKGSTFVEVEYANGEEERFDTPNMTAQVQQAVLAVFPFEGALHRSLQGSLCKRVRQHCLCVSPNNSCNLLTKS